MKELAPGVWHINTLPLPNAINAFVIGDVLVDAGGRRCGRRILKALNGHEVNAHAITHAHPDHQGASHELCEKLGIPFWVSEGDTAAAEDSSLIRQLQPDHPVARFYDSIYTGPGHSVGRRLMEGDDVAGFKVLEVPGHSAGHIAFWRESDGVLIAGDVLNNMNIWTGIPGLHEPKPYLTPDPARNRQSAKRLAELEPRLVLFGHGPPLRDTGKFVSFCQSL
jgi:glyoxylase-like metal-dependent hydrolase (beta-lactamase superfamily II)